ncbi:MAG TPA: bifunctional hydroxymethylpyrimidine kinase/phosphomethylpyrimidine kinase [Bacillota bacterium]|nr:bifunctional hydroxymethylpyrimidine kinase/phosphomethylpyrimidine kinase [Bacillota bacterium]
MFRAMTVAGSDSGGGAGIQADLRTFFALGVYGTSALTAITAQNTLGVRTVLALPPELVVAQMEAVLDDIGTDAVKTGMLGNAGIVAAVAGTLRHRGVGGLVVDPVMYAKSGHPLLDEGGRQAVIRELFPLAAVVTPNRAEAEALTGLATRDLDGAREAARRLLALGPRAVVVKGGHLPGEAVDIYHDGKVFLEYRSPRLQTRATHGTGCTLAAAIAAGLARGDPLPRAVETAKRYVTACIRHGLDLGRGSAPTGHWAAPPRSVMEGEDGSR